MKKTTSVSILGALALAACQGSVLSRASTGASLSSTGGSLSSTGGSLSSTGGGPTSTGGGPSSTGGGPTSIGGSPTSTGGSPTIDAGCVGSGSVASWAQRFSIAGTDETIDIGETIALPVAPDGSTVLSLEAQTGFMPPVWGLELVKLDPAGNVAWEQPWPSSTLAVSPTPDPSDGTTVVAGSLPFGSSQVPGATASCGSAACSFVARLDAGGAVQSIKAYDFGDDTWATQRIVGVLSDGRIALVGDFTGTVDLGSGPFSAPTPALGIYFALLSPTFDTLWSNHFTKPTGTYLSTAAVVSPAGEITVATTPDGSVDFGQGPIPADGGLVLASYDASGALRFGKVFPGKANPAALGRDSAGHLIVAQQILAPMDYGGGPIAVPTGGTTLAVVAFDAGGQYLWSTALGDSEARGFTVDGADHVWVGRSDGVIFELGAGGAVLSQRSICGSGNHQVLSIGVPSGGGAPVIVGQFDGTLDLGPTPLVAQSQTDIFIAGLAP